MITIFHTDCFAPKVADILTRLRDRAIQYPKSNKHLNSFAIGSVQFQPNGEVVWAVTHGEVGLKLNGSPYNEYFFYSKSTYQRKGTDQKKIKEWLAIMLKEAVFAALHTAADKKYPIYSDYDKRAKWVDEAWSRDNFTSVSEFSDKYVNFDKVQNDNPDDDVTIADLYCFYDKLLNRKRLLKSYTRKQVARIIGVERDPFVTELENIRREETAKLKANHEATMNSLMQAKNKALEEMRTKIYADFAKLENAEKAAYKTAGESLVSSLAFTQNLG